MANAIVEQFITQMTDNGWLCTDPDTLQFGRKIEGEALSYKICQVDYSDFVIAGVRHLATKHPLSIDELSANLIEEDVEFDSLEELIEQLEESGTNPDELDDESKLMVAAELRFEEDNVCLTPNLSDEPYLSASTLFGGDECEVKLSELVLIHVDVLEKETLNLGSHIETASFHRDFDTLKYAAAYWGSFNEYVPVIL